MQRQRNPVLLTSPVVLFKAAGVDPGLRFLGMAVLSMPLPSTGATGPKPLPMLQMIQVLETEKTPKKAMRDLRVSADDQRRLKYLWDRISQMLIEHRPQAMGVESYAPFPGQMGGSAWKVAFAYQLAMCAGWAYGILPMVFRPDDLKRRLLGKNAGTKVAVEDVLRTLVTGFGDALDKLPKTKREHAADAVGHALLALEEAAKMRAMYGGAF